MKLDFSKAALSSFLGYAWLAGMFLLVALGFGPVEEAGLSAVGIILLVEFISMHSLFFTAGLIEGWEKRPGKTKKMSVPKRFLKALKREGTVTFLFAYIGYGASIGLVGLNFTGSLLPLAYFLFSSFIKIFDLARSAGKPERWDKYYVSAAWFVISIIPVFTIGPLLELHQAVGLWGLVYFPVLAAAELLPEKKLHRMLFGKKKR
jgi:hypothetical protein